MNEDHANRQTQIEAYVRSIRFAVVSTLMFVYQPEKVAVEEANIIMEACAVAYLFHGDAVNKPRLAKLIKTATGKDMTEYDSQTSS